MRVAFAIACFFGLLLAHVEAPDRSALAESQREIATVSAIPVKHSFKVGEPIAVTVLLEAEGEGVYIQKGWGQAGGAIPGFYVDLESEHGERVPSCSPMVDGMPNEELDTRIVFAREFIFLESGQIIGWKTAIGCPPHKRGKYLVLARYSPDAPLSQRIASLAETKGRVVQEALDAKPAEIVIQ